MPEPEPPTAPDPEPIAAEPEPIATDPEPVPVDVQPQPVPDLATWTKEEKEKLYAALEEIKAPKRTKPERTRDDEPRELKPKRRGLRLRNKRDRP